MDLNVANIATGLVILYALVGATLVVLSATGAVDAQELQISFANYLEQMAIATGGLAIGRGLASRKA